MQRTASSAMTWLRKNGGKTNDKDDVISRLSTLGTSGAHPGNCERDMHRALHKVAKVLNAKIDYKPVRMWCPRTLQVVPTSCPLLLPHELLKAVWRQGEPVFRQLLFGQMSEDATKKYWDHVEKFCSWFASHPARQWHCKERLAAITSYGDEVNCYRNSECGVVSVCAWSAELAIKNDPLLRYYPVAVWSEHEECCFTYNDVIQHFAESLRQLADTSVIWPWTARHFHVTFTAIQGDLKWICDRMNGMHNFRQNEFCSRCECMKTHPNVLLTLPNFANDHGAHRERDYSHVDLAEAFSPLLGLPGMCVTRVRHDVMHSQYLGSGKTVNGALASYSASIACYLLLCCWIFFWLTTSGRAPPGRQGSADFVTRPSGRQGSADFVMVNNKAMICVRCLQVWRCYVDLLSGSWDLWINGWAREV